MTYNVFGGTLTLLNQSVRHKISAIMPSHVVFNFFRNSCYILRVNSQLQCDIDCAVTPDCAMICCYC